MPRELWGEFKEPERPVEPEQTIPLVAKRAKLEEMNLTMPAAAEKLVTIKANNPIVTQTIEVMKQTEMLQALIDTYSNKSEFANYLVNPCELIPDVNFPPENSADFLADNKFTKPIWFIPPIDTPFARGMPQHYAEISSEVCDASLRRAICGQLCVAGFTDTTESALLLFTDAVKEFIRAFMCELREIYEMDRKKETKREVDVRSLEKAYYGVTNTSLTQVHNYYKHNIVARNRVEVAEFKEALSEYDKLMQQSQNSQKGEFNNEIKNEIKIKVHEGTNEFATDMVQSSAIVPQHTQNYFDINGHKDIAACNNNDAIPIHNVQYVYASQIQQTQPHRPI